MVKGRCFETKKGTGGCANGGENRMSARINQQVTANTDCETRMCTKREPGQENDAISFGSDT